jgi:hypothetical protein
MLHRSSKKKVMLSRPGESATSGHGKNIREALHDKTEALSNSHKPICSCHNPANHGKKLKEKASVDPLG